MIERRRTEIARPTQPSVPASSAKTRFKLTAVECNQPNVDHRRHEETLDLRTSALREKHQRKFEGSNHAGHLASIHTHLHRQRCRPVAPTASRSRTSIAFHHPIALHPPPRIQSLPLRHQFHHIRTCISPRSHVFHPSSCSFRVDAQLAGCTLRLVIATDHDPSCMRVAGKGGRHSLLYFVLCKSMARSSLD